MSGTKYMLNKWMKNEYIKIQDCTESVKMLYMVRLFIVLPSFIWFVLSKWDYLWDFQSGFQELMSNHKGDYSLLNMSKNLSETTYTLSTKYPIADCISCGFALGCDWINGA